MALESAFSRDLKQELADRFPGCVIIKQDPNQLQGVPDLLVLYEDKWALLESKRATKAKRQPNQEWHVDHFNDMSFSAFIHPQNRDEVLDDLQHAFRPEG